MPLPSATAASTASSSHSDSATDRDGMTSQTASDVERIEMIDRLLSALAAERAMLVARADIMGEATTSDGRGASEDASAEGGLIDRLGLETLTDTFHQAKRNAVASRDSSS